MNSRTEDLEKDHAEINESYRIQKCKKSINDNHTLGLQHTVGDQYYDTTPHGNHLYQVTQMIFDNCISLIESILYPKKTNSYYLYG